MEVLSMINRSNPSSDSWSCWTFSFWFSQGFDHKTGNLKLTFFHDLMGKAKCKMKRSFFSMKHERQWRQPLPVGLPCPSQMKDQERPRGIGPINCWGSEKQKWKASNHCWYGQLNYSFPPTKIKRGPTLNPREKQACPTLHIFQQCMDSNFIDLLTSKTL